MHFKTGRLAGIAAATCLLVSTFIAVLSMTSVTIPPVRSSSFWPCCFSHCAAQYPSYPPSDPPPLDGRLDCGYVNSLWLWRHAFFPWQIAIEFFLAMGLLMVIHPVNCLNKLYSRTAPRLVLTVMTLCFTAGVAVNAFEFLENLGTEATGTHLSSVVSECPDRVSLEIAYNLGEALSIWIFSLDYIFLAIGFGLSAYLGIRYSLFSSWHGVVGGIWSALLVVLFL